MELRPNSFAPGHSFFILNSTFFAPLNSKFHQKIRGETESLEEGLNLLKQTNI